MVSIVGLGAGGHAKVVLEILQNDPNNKIMGLLDIDTALHGQSLLGIPILGADDLLENLVEQGLTHFFVGLGSIGNTQPRKRLYELGLAHGLHPVSAIHPSAILSSWAQVGRGCTIMAGAIINANATIGNNVIINSGAIVEHDCVIGNHVHIAIGAKLASTINVYEGAHIGAGATIKQCIVIGKESIVGAGAVVVHDVPDSLIVVGIPARELSKRNEYTNYSKA